MDENNRFTLACVYNILFDMGVDLNKFDVVFEKEVKFIESATSHCDLEIAIISFAIFSAINILNIDKATFLDKC